LDIISSNPRDSFNRDMSDLLSDMQDSFDNGEISDNIEKYQKRLDDIASTSQKNASLGRLRYKLYEAQAYLYYFRNDNEQAKRFIREAVRVRGEKFDRAVTLNKLISQSTKEADEDSTVENLPLTKLGRYVKKQWTEDWSEPRPPDNYNDDDDEEDNTKDKLESAHDGTVAKSELVDAQNITLKSHEYEGKIKHINRLGGWLAYFTLGIIISIGYSIYNAYSYGQLLSQGVNPNYKARVIALMGGFILLGILQLTSVVLLFLRREYAKQIVIISLVAIMVMYGIDGAFINSVYKSINQSVPTTLSDGITRTEILGFIWIIYFISSKRVKLTLTK